VSYADLFNLFTFALLLSSVGLAGALGGRCEREGACLYGGLSFAILVVQAFGTGPHLAVILVGLDFLTALGFVAIAFRYPEKLWPGVAACAQYFVFTLSFGKLVGFPLNEVLLIRASTISSVNVSAALVAGTWAARWRKAPVDPWEEYAATLARLPAAPPIPPRATWAST
jgi:hypothetical protein